MPNEVLNTTRELTHVFLTATLSSCPILQVRKLTPGKVRWPEASPQVGGGCQSINCGSKLCFLLGLHAIMNLYFFSPFSSLLIFFLYVHSTQVLGLKNYFNVFYHCLLLNLSFFPNVIVSFQYLMLPLLKEKCQGIKLSPSFLS